MRRSWPSVILAMLALPVMCGCAGTIRLQVVDEYLPPPPIIIYPEWPGEDVDQDRDCPDQVAVDRPPLQKQQQDQRPRQVLEQRQQKPAPDRTRNVKEPASKQTKPIAKAPRGGSRGK